MNGQALPINISFPPEHAAPIRCRYLAAVTERRADLDVARRAESSPVTTCGRNGAAALPDVEAPEDLPGRQVPRTRRLGVGPRPLSLASVMVSSVVGHGFAVPKGEFTSWPCTLRPLRHHRQALKAHDRTSATEPLIRSRLRPPDLVQGTGWGYSCDYNCGEITMAVELQPGFSSAMGCWRRKLSKDRTGSQCRQNRRCPIPLFDCDYRYIAMSLAEAFLGVVKGG